MYTTYVDSDIQAKQWQRMFFESAATAATSTWVCSSEAFHTGCITKKTLAKVQLCSTVCKQHPGKDTKGDSIYTTSKVPGHGKFWCWSHFLRWWVIFLNFLPILRVNMFIFPTCYASDVADGSANACTHSVCWFYFRRVATALWNLDHHHHFHVHIPAITIELWSSSIVVTAFYWCISMHTRTHIAQWS